MDDIGGKEKSNLLLKLKLNHKTGFDNVRDEIINKFTEIQIKIKLRVQ